MDIVSLVFGFGGGIISTVAVVYTYAKSQGLISGDYSKLEESLKLR